MEAPTALATSLFADRLAAAVERKRSQLLAGLDPRPEQLPVELRGAAQLDREQAATACARFCCGVIDAVAPHVVGVKAQLAFFEALGSAGMKAFEDVCAYARSAELIVIADAKRGDIGSTARAYASAYLEKRNGDPPLADAITVHAYLGRESLEPFLQAARRHGAGVFCVVKTSNAGGDVQDVVLSHGRPMWQHVAAQVADWGAELVGEHGLSAVGAVVGATHPRAVGEARRLMPQAIMLLPGVGVQGATPADLARAFQSGPASALVAASRFVIYASRRTGGGFREAAGAEAARLRREIWAASGWR
jgi:orotidine-5'-phosphate decarboxylase